LPVNTSRCVDARGNHKLHGEQRLHMQRFIAALRSGRYAQTQGKLRMDNLAGKPAFCCLGVACDLVSRSGEVNIVWEPNNGDYAVLDADGDESQKNFGWNEDGTLVVDRQEGLLPAAIIEVFGIAESSGHVHIFCDEMWDEHGWEGTCDHGQYRDPGRICKQLIGVEATSLNDDVGWDFDRIAEAFERTYLGM